MWHPTPGTEFYSVRRPWPSRRDQLNPFTVPEETPGPVHSWHHPFCGLCAVALRLSAELLFATKHAFAVTDAPNAVSLLSSRNGSCVVPQVQCCPIFALFNNLSGFCQRIKLPGCMMGFQLEQRSWPCRCQPSPSTHVHVPSHSRWERMAYPLPTGSRHDRTASSEVVGLILHPSPSDGESFLVQGQHESGAQPRSYLFKTQDLTSLYTLVQCYSFLNLIETSGSILFSEVHFCFTLPKGLLQA